jgi:hypothetical protein
VSEVVPESFAERLGVPRKRKPNDQYMVVTEVFLDAVDASATLEGKLGIIIAPEIIARMADERKIGHRRAVNFSGENIGDPRFTLADLADLADRLELDPRLTDPEPPKADDRHAQSRSPRDGYWPKRGSFAYSGPADRDEQDAYPDAIPNSCIARFISEMCTTAPFPKGGSSARVRASSLYEALAEWWQIEELSSPDLPTRNAVGRHLTRLGFVLSQEWDNRLRESANYRLGLRLKLKAELAADDDRQAAPEPTASQSSARATTRKRRTPANADEPRAGEATETERLAAK